MEALGDNEVHVWHAQLSALTGELPRLAAVLCPEERARAARFQFERDRNQFMLARAVLRSLLAEYGGTPAAEIAFGYGPRGKPVLLAPGGDGGAQVEFNVSHTQGMAVFAFTRNRPVGIDIEYVREVNEADGIVAGQFAAEEIAAYQALPAAMRRRGFFYLWTRKEAYIKALGEGLGHPLDRFAVSLEPGVSARFLRIGSDPASWTEWTLRDLALDAAYIAAVAVPGAGLEIRSWSWPLPAGRATATTRHSPLPPVR